MTTICIDIKALICPLPRSLFLLLSPVTGSMSPGSTSQILARKKRRGVSLHQSSSVFPLLVREQTKSIIRIWSRYKVSSVNAGLFQNSLQHDPLQQHAFLQFKPSCLTLICVFLVDFPSIFSKNLILRMLQLSLSHKNNPVSKCFPLQIVVLCLNWFRWIPQIIEKRRRDRINHSLSELRRLVPSAFEKQVRCHRLSLMLYIVYSKQQSQILKKVLKLKPVPSSHLVRAPLNWKRLRFFRWPWIIWNCCMPWAAKVREDTEWEISGEPSWPYTVLLIMWVMDFGKSITSKIHLST